MSRPRFAAAWAAILAVTACAAAPPVPPGPADEYKYAGLPPDKAAAVMTVPEGFTVTLFAGEPDVHQPIAMCLDDRGRLWVAEAYTYPRRHPSPGPVIPDRPGRKQIGRASCRERVERAGGVG